MRATARWGPVLAWMALIFVGSAQSTLPPLVPYLPQEVVNDTGHLLEYTVLAVLLLRAMMPFPQLLSLSICFWSWNLTWLYGVTDEIHQRWVPGRSSSVGDVLFDAFGGFLGLLLFLLWQTRSRQKEGASDGHPS